MDMFEQTTFRTDTEKAAPQYFHFSNEYLRQSGAGYYHVLWLSFLLWSFIMAAFGIAHLFLLHVFHYRASVIGNSAILFTAFITIPLLLFGCYLFKDLLMRMVSYKYEDGNIVKGKIINIGQTPGDLISSGIISAVAMAQILGNFHWGMTSATASRNMKKVQYLIRLNSCSEYVQATFDTEQYHKKVYLHPTLVKETKYHWIFRTEDGKKLRIIKAYDLQPCKNSGRRPKAVSRRVLGCLGIMVCLTFAIYAADFCYSASINDSVVENFNTTVADLSFFEDYGYEINQYRCQKEVGDRFSELKLEIDSHGNLVRFIPDLYFVVGDPSARPIAEFLLNEMGSHFAEADQQAFLQAVDRFVSGDFSESLTIVAEDTGVKLTIITDGKTYFRIR